MKYYRFSYYFCFLFLFMIFSGCQSKMQKTLIVGVEEYYPPFAFINNNGQADGFDVDLFRAIAEKIDYKIEFKTMKFDVLENALQNGQIDAIAGGYSITPERQEKFLFSQVYYHPNLAVIYKIAKFTSNDLVNLADLGKIKIGVQNGSTMQDFLRTEINKNSHYSLEIKPYQNIFELVKALKKNDIEALIVEDLQAELIVQNNAELGYFVLSEQESNQQSYAFAFRKDFKMIKDVNKIITELNDNGKIDILKLRWFSSYGIYANMLK